MRRPLHALSLTALITYLILITSIPCSSLQSTHQSGLRDSTSNNTDVSHLRIRRSYSYDRHVEVLVVADHSMSEYHGTNLRHYLLTLMSTVSMIYKDASIGNAINVAVVRIHVLSPHETQDIVYSSVSRTLRLFCRWQRLQVMGLSDEDQLFHDAAILVTRKDLCREPRSCDTLGLAQLGAVCDPRASCAVIEDNGLSAGFTIAHELAHIMSIPHDDAEKCMQSKGSGLQEQLVAKSSILIRGVDDHIMSRALHYNSHPWSWSKCSKAYLTEFFDAGNGDCLLDEPKVNLLDEYSPQVATGIIGSRARVAYATAPETRTVQQPGELFDPDYQCQLVFGPTSKICPYMPACRRLWCTIGKHGGCRTQHMPWADGTSCGKLKWCQKGGCVSRLTASEPKQDGGWGEWTAFTPCSRSCGGGVQKSSRDCDRPAPRNGGKYCVGHRVQYRSCNTHPCPGRELDDRAKQCAAFNGQDMGIHGLPVFPLWLPHTKDVPREEACKLFCTAKGSRAYYLLQDKVIDGTPCYPDVDDVCVNGKCFPAGCDRVLYSHTKRDSCGVCGGNNSTCAIIRRSIRPTNLKYGYSTILILPVNSTSVLIEHKKIKRRVENNYLALRDEAGHYLLNGDFVINMYPKSVVMDEDGTVAEYSGSKAEKETIVIRNTIRRKVMVEILSMGTTSPLITYEYSIIKKKTNRMVRPDRKRLPIQSSEYLKYETRN